MLWLSPVSAADSRLDRILASGELRVGTTGDFKPLSFKNPVTGDYEGYDIDWARKFAADMGVELVFVPTEWKTLIAGVVSDKYDITTSVSVSLERAQVAGYSKRTITFATVPVANRAVADRFDGWESLNSPDVTIAVTLGTTFEDEARAYFPNANLLVVEAPIRGYQEVLAGRADATISSTVDAAELTATHDQLVVVSTDTSRNARPGAMLLPRDDQTWINFVNTWIDLRNDEGYFDALLAQYNISQ